MKLLKALRRRLAIGLLFPGLFPGSAFGASSPFFTVLPMAQRPPDVLINLDAGFGNWIIVNLHLAGGEAFPAVLDTGCPTTCLDKSFESKLGKCIETNTLWDFGAKSQVGVYLAPKLFLESAPLVKIGPYAVTDNCKEISSAVGHPVMGILGMDVLQNYCIQLDFVARKIRFIDYDRAVKSRWGTAFALMDLGDGCVAIDENLAGVPGPGSLVDTGYNQDGWLVPGLFDQWTNHETPLHGHDVHSPNGVLGDQIYTGLNLRKVDPKLIATDDAHIKLNGIGLRFLARHLVTLDFPEQTLYLKCIDNGPPVDKEMESQRKSEGKSAVKFLKKLELQGHLPGWSKSDAAAAGRVTVNYTSADSVECAISKNGDPFIFHYTLTRASDRSPWQLQRAWETGAMGQVVNEYPARRYQGDDER